jgi:hypothetical protein
MPDLQAARHALDRTLIFVDREGCSSGENVTLSATDFNALVACRDALDSLLSRPADYVGELVVPDEWMKDEIGGEYWRWSTTFGDYDICLDGMTWHYSVFGGMNLRCDSLEHGKALCLADFLGRIAGALRGAKS